MTNDTRLNDHIDALVRIAEERATLANDAKAILEVAKEQGFDPKAMRVVVKRRMEGPEKAAKREAAELAAEQMLASLGMLRDTPLGNAAMGNR